MSTGERNVNLAEPFRTILNAFIGGGIVNQPEPCLQDVVKQRAEEKGNEAFERRQELVRWLHENIFDHRDPRGWQRGVTIFDCETCNERADAILRIVGADTKGTR